MSEVVQRNCVAVLRVVSGAKERQNIHFLPVPYSLLSGNTPSRLWLNCINMAPKKKKSPKGDETRGRQKSTKITGEAVTLENPMKDLVQPIPRKTRSQDKSKKEIPKPSLKIAPMQQPEVINVDDSSSITILDPNMRAAYTLKKLFPEIKATTSLMEYLFCVTKHPTFSSDASGQKQDQVLTALPPFTLIALFYLQNIVQSKLLLNLASRTLPTSVKACFFDKTALKNVCRFQLCHMHPNDESTLGKTRSRIQSLEKKKY